MKILRLRFKNINSLAGEHEVLFDKGPLAKASLFAIIGPTGSGKSTLLDVITLALYGKVPRFASVTNTTVEQEGSIVTHHRDMAFAEVTYRAKGGIYVSSWSIRKTRTGRWKDHDMEVSSAGKILESKKSKVPVLNESVIGLTYGQFTKAILLSQGQFAQFLTASKDERGKLLEDITGTGIYRRIGEVTFQHHKLLQQELDQASQRIADIELLEEDVITELQAQSEALARRRTEVDLAVEALLATHTALLTRTALLQTEVDQVAVLRQASEQLASIASEVNQLAKHELIAPVAPDLHRLDTYRSQLEVLRQKHVKVVDQEAAVDKTLATTVSQLEVLIDRPVTRQDFVVEVDRLETTVAALDQELAVLKANGKQARERIMQVIQQGSGPVAQHLASIQDPDLLLIEVTARRQALSLSSSVSVDLEELATSVEELDVAVPRLQEYRSQLSRRDSAIALQREGRDRISQLLAPLELDQQKVSEAKKQVDTAQGKLQALQEQKLSFSAVAALEDRRGNLTEGEPCPLCGATHHPYADPKALHQYVEIDLRIGQVQKEVTAANAIYIQAGQDLSARKSSIAATEQQVKRLDEQLYKEQAEIDKLLIAHSAWQELDMAGVETELVSLKQRRKDLDELSSRVRADRYLGNIEQEIGALSSAIAAYRVVLEQRRAVFGDKSMRDILKPMQETFASLSSRHIALREQREAGLREQTHVDHQIRTITATLTGHAQTCGYPDIASMEAHLLDAATATSIRQRHQQLKDRHTRGRAALDQTRRQLHDLNEAVKGAAPVEEVALQLQQGKHQQGLISEQLGAITQQLADDAKRRSRFGELAADVAERETAIRVWRDLTQMIGSRHGDRFANYAQSLTLRNLIALANRRLDGLSDRYLIDMPDGSDQLRIIDRYQGDIARSVVTLSGGETFLISLALALSLSDMASRNVRLESLFIDEGFGTLDQDTLELALSTLERLQADSDKTIGIISHVEALKERITTQIILHKSDNGVSTIEVSGQ